MNVFYTRYYLLVHFRCFIFFKPSVFDDVLEKLSSWAVLHDKVEIIIILDHFVKLDHMRMSHFFEDGNFSVDSIDIGLVFDLVFFQNLYCYLIASYNVCPLLNLTKCSFALCFPYNKASNFLSFTVFLFFLSILITIKVSWWRFRAIFGSLFVCRRGSSRILWIILIGIIWCITITLRHISALNCDIIISHLLIRCLVCLIIMILIFR